MTDEEMATETSDGRHADTSPEVPTPDGSKDATTVDGDVMLTGAKGRTHDPLVLGLSIVGVVLGVMAMLASCVGDAVILRLGNRVGAPCVRQSERDRDELSIDTGDHGTGVGCIGVRAISHGDGDGAMVVDTLLGGAAYDAGLEAGDVIVRFGDMAVTDAAALVDIVRDATPGSAVTVTYVRDGVTLATDVMVGDIADMGDLVGAVRSGSFDGGMQSNVVG